MEHLPRGHTADDAAPSTARPSSETVRATAAAPTAGQPRATGDVQRRGPHESSLPASRDSDPLIGRVVGDVLIQEWIASGGMGHVYRGLQRTPQRPVAVKFGWPLNLDRLREEARACSKARLKEIYQATAVEIMEHIARLEPCADKTVFP